MAVAVEAERPAVGGLRRALGRDPSSEGSSGAPPES